MNKDYETIFKLIKKLAIISLIILAVIFGAYILVSSLISCNEIGCTFEFNEINFFPYTDFSENIIGGLNIAHGYRFGVDFSQPHFPGLYIALGWLYKLLGYSNAIPSEATAVRLIFISAIGVLGLFLIFGKMSFGIRKSAIICMLVLLIFGKYTLFLPMSETLAFWISIPLLYSNLELLEGKKFGINIVDLFLPILIVFFGIGFPGLLIAPYLLYAYLIVYDRRYNIQKKDLIVFFLLVLILINLLIISTDISKIKYWAIDINVVDVKPLLLNNIYRNITEISAINNIYSLLVYLPLPIFLILFLHKVKKISRFVTIIYFLGLLFSMYWRVSEGYKILPVLSIIIALLTYAYSDLNYRKYLIYILYVIVIIYYIWGNSIIFLSKSIGNNYNNGNSVDLSKYNICKIDDNPDAGCHCLQTMVFGPQFYLLNNFKQCKHQINTWSSRMGLSKSYVDIVIDSINNKSASFYIPPIQYYQDDLPLTEIIARIKSIYSCSTLKNNFVFCTP